MSEKLPQTRQRIRISVLLFEPWPHFLRTPAVRSLSTFATVSTVGAAPAGTKADQCGGAGFASVMPSNATQSWQGSYIAAKIGNTSIFLYPPACKKPVSPC